MTFAFMMSIIGYFVGCHLALKNRNIVYYLKFKRTHIYHWSQTSKPSIKEYYAHGYLLVECYAHGSPVGCQGGCLLRSVRLTAVYYFSFKFTAFYYIYTASNSSDKFPVIQHLQGLKYRILRPNLSGLGRTWVTPSSKMCSITDGFRSRK